MTEWQLIETAPRDGTAIAVYMPWCSEVRTAHWSKQSSPRRAGDGGWTVHWSRSHISAMGKDEPPYWTPLPAPPTEIEINRAKSAET